jgi:hypothetical protein
MTATRPALSLLGLLGGFVIWGSCFNALYALHATGCELLWPADRLRLLLIAVWLGHLALLAALLAWCERRRRAGGAADADGFLTQAASGLTAAALGATILTGLPAAVLSLC